jgi:hypothetical protein
MKRLRSPDGCPWDNKQTIESVLKYFLEEAYEALDAADRRDWPGLAEELATRCGRFSSWPESPSRKAFFPLMRCCNCWAKR